MNRTEEVTIHGIGLTSVGGTYDVFESVGFTLRAGGVSLHDIRDELQSYRFRHARTDQSTSLQVIILLISTRRTGPHGQAAHQAVLGTVAESSRVRAGVIDYVDGMKNGGLRQKHQWLVGSLGHRRR